MAPKPKSNAMQNSLSDQNPKSFKWQHLVGKYDEIKQVICSLGQEKFAPRAHRYDKEASFPFENYDDMREVGILAMTVAEFTVHQMQTLTTSWLKRLFGPSCRRKLP